MHHAALDVSFLPGVAVVDTWRAAALHPKAALRVLKMPTHTSAWANNKALQASSQRANTTVIQGLSVRPGATYRVSRSSRNVASHSG